ncbi:serine hydrolase domain-containing protein [Maricaulis sp.]|uniref:serine hydrolase domain-containing protein n=1 Tax=Maricaulis sp. TaxID=1486257 RepID=UPI002635C9B8|nr:serine hydrolase domain-containing protein [Maricaulis sp.]
MRFTWLPAICLFFLSACSSPADPTLAAADRFQGFLDALPEPGPGFAIVAVSSDEVLISHVSGARRASTAAPMRADTPVYIASQTKAFMGLLAARLDADGVLSLDSTLADHWPDLVLPGDLDPADWTMRDLLSHEFPLRAPPVAVMEAYVGEVYARDYPRLLALYGEVREPGFSYSNLGYNIYSAILMDVTGRSWQAWLDTAVFDPLGMANSSAITSDLEASTLSWGHIWQGEALGWYEMPPKPDAIMQSAGGLFVSPEDMAVWLQMILRREGPAGSGLSAEIIDEGLAPAAALDRDPEARMPCEAYALGWGVCEFQGTRVYQHGGGYTGTRSFMAVAPELDVAIAVFANSTRETSWLRRETVFQFLQEVMQDPGAADAAQERIEAFESRLAQHHANALSREAEARANPRWGGWDWSPAQSEISAFAGEYTTGEPYLDLAIVEDRHGLHLVWGHWRMQLEPATENVFAGHPGPFQTMEPVTFLRGLDGAVTGLEYDGHVYQRVGID